MSRTRKIALTGMLVALAVVLMMTGGLIPLATFCSPALAGLLLLPVFVECGEKIAWGAYISIALLSLMLSPDKEAALLFAFIGYYPLLRWRLEQIKTGVLRVLAKLGVFNAAVIAMYLLCIFVFKLDQVLKDYAEMGLILSLVCLLLGNVTLLIYDRLCAIWVNLYVVKLRDKLIR